MIRQISSRWGYLFCPVMMKNEHQWDKPGQNHSHTWAQTGVKIEWKKPTLTQTYELPVWSNCCYFWTQNRPTSIDWNTQLHHIHLHLVSKGFFHSSLHTHTHTDVVICKYVSIVSKSGEIYLNNAGIMFTDCRLSLYTRYMGCNWIDSSWSRTLSVNHRVNFYICPTTDTFVALKKVVMLGRVFCKQPVGVCGSASPPLSLHRGLCSRPLCPPV